MPNLAKPYLEDHEHGVGMTINVGGLDYQLVSELGRGGVATVYEALDPERKSVAVKIYRPDTTDIVKKAVQIGFETRLQHADIPQNLLAFPHTHQMPRVAVCNYAEGIDAQIEGTRHALLEKRIPKAKDLVTKTMPILELLMKRNLAHRDLKGENLIVSPTGEDVTLVDFDFLVDITKPKTDRDFLGTPIYCSPEQAKGKTSSTMDIFGLGAGILYSYMDYRSQHIVNIGKTDESPSQVRIRRPNVASTSPLSVREKLLNLDRFPEAVRTDVHGLICFLIAALQPDPTARPKTAEEVRQLLAAVPNNTMNYGVIASSKP